MKNFKDKIEKFASEKKNKIFPFCNDSFKFLEKEKNIFYFSKFSFLLTEFKKIYSFVHNIKTNTFRHLIHPCKKLIKDFLDFPKVLPTQDSENEKILTVFHLLFLHYYLNFGYDINNDFEQFYNYALGTLTTNNFHIIVKNEEMFKTFAYAFYNKLKNEISNNDYEGIKSLYLHYNPEKNEDEEMKVESDEGKEVKENNIIISENENGGLNNQALINNNTSNNKNGNEGNVIHEHEDLFQKSKIFKFIEKFKLKHLFNGKEKMIDIVYSVKGDNLTNTDVYIKASKLLEEIHMFTKQEYYKIITQSSSNALGSSSVSLEQTEGLTNNNKNTNNNNTNSCFKEFTIIENTKKNVANDMDCSFSSKSQVQTSFSSDENCSLYSKRIYTEMTKFGPDEETQKLIDEIAEKIDENYLDKLLNKKINCSFHAINSLMCYLVEITPQMIRKIKEFKEVTKNLTLRFIVPAKEIYNRILEVYFSLFDLYNTNINTFYYMTKKFVKASCQPPIYTFCKLVSNVITKEKSKGENNIDVILNMFYEEVINLWNVSIQDGAKDFSHFTSV